MNILSLGLVFCLFAVFSIMVFSKEENHRFDSRSSIKLGSRPAKPQENDHEEKHNGTFSRPPRAQVNHNGTFLRPPKAQENDHEENHNGTFLRPPKAQENHNGTFLRPPKAEEKVHHQNRPFNKH